MFVVLSAFTDRPTDVGLTNGPSKDFFEGTQGTLQIKKTENNFLNVLGNSEGMGCKVIFEAGPPYI
jgi:hypothetical protein